MAGQTNEQTKGKIGLLSQWTMEGWDEQIAGAAQNIDTNQSLPKTQQGERIKKSPLLEASLAFFENNDLEVNKPKNWSK